MISLIPRNCQQDARRYMLSTGLVSTIPKVISSLLELNVHVMLANSASLVCCCSSCPGTEDDLVTFGRELLQPKQQTNTKTQQPAAEKSRKRDQKTAASPPPGGRHLLDGESCASLALADSECVKPAES